jgi:hypothetical protein
MASLGFLGALSGASGQALDAIKSRQDEEREQRKMRLLEELRRDTAVYLADYQDQLDQKNVDKDLSSFDPTTGEFINRNKRGEELSRRADPGAAEDYQFKKNQQDLSLDAIRANIAQSNASAGASNAQAALARKSASALDQANPAPTLMSRANEIAFRQKSIVNDLISIGVPADAVQTLALESVRQAAARGLTPAQAEEFFVKGAETLRNKAKGASYNTNKEKRASPLDMFSQ